MDYTTTPSRYRILLVVVVVGMLLMSTAPIIVSASDNETADDFFDSFRAMEGTEAYQEYEEFETIRTFAVSQTQEAGQLDAQQRAQLGAIESAMVSFEQAHEEADDGEYEQSLETAEDVEDAIEELGQYEETQATLASLALSRFYEDLALGLRDEAEESDHTPTEVELLSMTARAYERADRPDEAAQFNQEAEQRDAEYGAAVERIEDSEATAEAFFESCSGCDSIGGALAGLTNPVATFQQYQQSQSVVTEIQDAEADAASHGLSEQTDDLEPLSETASSTWLSLLVASVTVLLGYGLVLGVVSTALLVRIFAWRRAYDKAQVGSVVTVGDSNA